MNNIKCKFEVFCSFEHDIEGLVQHEETEDKIKILERLIEDKDEEIERLRKRLRESNIFQLDGDFMIDHESESSDDTSDQESDDDITDIEVDRNSQDHFKCDHCEFVTKHKNGLKIHIGRVHKLKCENCEQNVQDEDCLQRHKSAKKVLANIDPHLSPDETMKLEILRNDESCLVILDAILNTNLLQLHCWSCWSRDDHSCPDLPPESVSDEQPRYNTRHTDIGSVVMGDLSMAGCYLDWNQAKMMIEAGQKQA